MRKRKPASGIGIFLAFIGLTGRRDDFVATIEHIDMLGLPAWADWSLVGVGAALLLYGFWPRNEATEAMDREWSEEGALKVFDLRQQHHRELFPQYVGAFGILAIFIVILVLITTCEGPRNNEIVSQKIYLKCLETKIGNPELCERIILGESQAIEGQETKK